MRLILSLGILLITMSSQAQNDTLPEIDKLWDFSDPAATEQRFKDVMLKPEAKADSTYYGQLITQLTRTYSLRGMFKEGHDVLNELTEWPLQQYPIVEVRYFLERGRLYNSAGEKDKAIEQFRNAWDSSVANLLEYFAVDAAHMLAIASPLEEQIVWAHEAIKVAEVSEDTKTRNWLGPLYNNLGWTYADKEEYEKALELFQKGLEFREKHTTNQQGIRIAKWTVAHMYRKLQRYDEALDLQLKLEEEIHTNDLPADGYVFEELGELHLIKGDPEKATDYFAKAYNILSKDNWLVNNEADRIARLKELGKVD